MGAFVIQRKLDLGGRENHVMLTRFRVPPPMQPEPERGPHNPVPNHHPRLPLSNPFTLNSSLSPPHAPSFAYRLLIWVVGQFDPCQ